MGNPRFVKTIFWLALLIGGAVFGVRYIQQHPDAADIQKTQPGVYRPQPANNGGNDIVVIP